MTQELLFFAPTQTLKIGFSENIYKKRILIIKNKQQSFQSFSTFIFTNIADLNNSGNFVIRVRLA